MIPTRIFLMILTQIFISLIYIYHSILFLCLFLFFFFYKKHKKRTITKQDQYIHRANRTTGLTDNILVLTIIYIFSYFSITTYMYIVGTHQNYLSAHPKSRLCFSQRSQKIYILRTSYLEYWLNFETHTHKKALKYVHHTNRLI